MSRPFDPHKEYMRRFRAMPTSAIIAHLISRAIDDHLDQEHSRDGCVPSLEIQVAYEVLDERLPQTSRQEG